MRLSLSRTPALCAGMAMLLCGCNLGGLVGTEIEVTGGRHTVEEQVLGAYEHIGEEVYVLAGVRSVDPVTGVPEPPPPMTPSEARALQARRRMEFNRDDVLEFKKKGHVGEGNDGLLVIFEEGLAALRADSPRYVNLLQAVVAEENEDRLTIMRRIVDTTPALRGEKGMGAVGRILAARRRQEAEPGSRVQEADGTWTTTGEGP